MGGDGGAKPISVLIVDDEQDLVEVLTKRLSKRGYDVDAVGSGEAAIERLDRQATSTWWCSTSRGSACGDRRR